MDIHLAQKVITLHEENTKLVAERDAYRAAFEQLLDQVRFLAATPAPSMMQEDIIRKGNADNIISVFVKRKIIDGQ